MSKYVIYRVSTGNGGTLYDTYETVEDARKAAMEYANRYGVTCGVVECVTTFETLELVKPKGEAK